MLRFLFTWADECFWACGRIATPALLSVCMFCGLISPIRAQQTQEALFREGLSAYERSDYKLAMQIWHPLAEQEHAKSQAGLGFLLMRGLLGFFDDPTAAYWLRKAAEQGQPEGQMLLGRLYLDGRGVDRNPALAFAWCEIAIDHGAMGGGGCRTLALQQMATHEDMLRAFQLVVDMRKLFHAMPDEPTR